MTYETCMYMVDQLQPNQVPQPVKNRWLGELEGRVQVELEGASPSNLMPPELLGEDITLSAPFPYDNIYWLYLLAMLDFASGDGARYENSAALFNAAYHNYAKWVARNR